MSAENRLNTKYTLRTRSMYNITPSVVLRVVDYTPNVDEVIPATYKNDFIKPFLPLAVIAYNVPNSPFPGVLGPDIDVVETITEGNAAVTFGFDITALLNEYPTRHLFYSILKAEISDLEYIKILAEQLPDECWIESMVNVTVTNIAYRTDIFNNNKRLLILEKR